MEEIVLTIQGVFSFKIMKSYEKNKFLTDIYYGHQILVLNNTITLRLSGFSNYLYVYYIVKFEME